MITDPYCPAVRTMAPEDTPFVFKSNEEFPAKRLSYMNAEGGRRWGDSQVETIQSVIKLRECPYQKEIG
jgi:hypothetical protein